MKKLVTGLTCAFCVSLLTLPAAAQGMSGGKGKEPVIHIPWVGLEAGANEEVSIAGPFAAGTTFEIFDITTVNLSPDPVMVQYRLVEPDDGFSCLGNAVVRDEIMRVVTPGSDSLHQVFVEGLEVPGQFGGGDSTAPACLIVFLPSDSIFPSGFEAKAEGRITLRINSPE